LNRPFTSSGPTTLKSVRISGNRGLTSEVNFLNLARTPSFNSTSSNLRTDRRSKIAR